MKLSIITINYNNLEGLKRTAESVINQTWRDFEWIIVDGGSTDGSKEYIEQLAACLSGKEPPSPILHLPSSISHLSSSIFRVTWHTERFSMPGFTAEDFQNIENSQPSTLNSQPALYWCSEPDKGIYNAMNKGIVTANGEYLNFMNSGDYFFEPETLNKIFSQNHSEGILYGDYVKYIGGIKENRKPIALRLSELLRIGLNHQSTFIKRTTFENRFYDESYKIAADRKHFVESLLHNETFKYLDQIICYFEGTGLGNCQAKLLEDEIKRLGLEVIPNYLQNDMNDLAAFKYSDSYYPELSELRILLPQRRLYRKIVRLVLAVINYLNHLNQ